MRRIHPHHGLSDVVNGFWSFTLSRHGVCLWSCGFLVRFLVFSSLGGFLVWSVCLSLLALHVPLGALGARRALTYAHSYIITSTTLKKRKKKFGADRGSPWCNPTDGGVGVHWGL